MDILGCKGNNCNDVIIWKALGQTRHYSHKVDHNGSLILILFKIIKYSFHNCHDAVMPTYKVSNDFLPWSNVVTSCSATNALIWEKPYQNITTFTRVLQDDIKVCSFFFFLTCSKQWHSFRGKRRKYTQKNLLSSVATVQETEHFLSPFFQGWCILLN